MARTENRYVCQLCGYESFKWLGKCPGCNEWNSFASENIPGPVHKTILSQPVPIDQIPASSHTRLHTGMDELDLVLGGGVVAGSLVLVGGDPGIGKSTLLLQVAYYIGNIYGSVLYVSGEESAQQLKLRAERLGKLSGNLSVITETDVVTVAELIKQNHPRLVVIDSIQTMYHNQLEALPGSISQIRETTGVLQRIAKETGIPMILVGHVNKEGFLAGPRVLEHIVDCVLYFEGERNSLYRLLRTAKNRFGSTNEIGVFLMGDQGLMEVNNPSSLFVEKRASAVAGSVVVSTLEGTRPVLAELQALVVATSFGNPRRLCSGIDLNRMLLMVAVIEKKIGMVLGNYDIYLNVVGGMKIVEPAADLSICLAIASSLHNQALQPNLLVIGEVGLTGEVRPVAQLEKRLTEGIKLGFTHFVFPRRNQLAILEHRDGIQWWDVDSVKEALEVALAR